MKNKKIKNKIENDILHFVGSEKIYKNKIFNFFYTEGTRYIAQNCGAYWLLDEIAILGKGKGEFIVAELRRSKYEKNSFFLLLTDGNGNSIESKRIPFSNFPLDEIKLYFENNTICLPRER